MKLSPDDMLSLLIRQERFDKRMEELRFLIEGSDKDLAALIGAGDNYSARNTHSIVRDIADAYDKYWLVTEAHDQGITTADVQNRWDTMEANGELEMVEEDPRYSHARTFLKSMTYCILRLYADSPWDFGSCSGPLDACRQLVRSFGQDVPADRFRAEMAARHILAGGTPEPATPRSIVETHFGYYSYRFFPTLSDELLPAADEHPTFFLDDLNQVYEVLCGKPITSSLTKKQIAELADNKELFAFLKEPAQLEALNDNEAAIALERGWIGQADIDHRELLLNMKREAEDRQRALDEEAGMPYGSWWGEPLTKEEADALAREEEQENADEADRIAKWAAAFPDKDVWCKNYLALRRAYFAIDDIERAQFRRGGLHEINVHELNHAFRVVLEDRGISHFTDAAYDEAYDRLYGAIVNTQRRIAYGGR